MLSSAAAALQGGRGGSSSFSKSLTLRLRGPSSSQKRGKWFRPRLVALTLLLAAVWGVKDEQPSLSKAPLPQKRITGPTAAPLPFPEPPYSFAHRGASGLLPEHSMPAYMLAVEQVRFTCTREGERRRGGESERAKSRHLFQWRRALDSHSRPLALGETETKFLRR